MKRDVGEKRPKDFWQKYIIDIFRRHRQIDILYDIDYIDQNSVLDIVSLSQKLDLWIRSFYSCCET